MEKKNYVEPELEIVELNKEDVIVTSDDNITGGEVPEL